MYQSSADGRAMTRQHGSAVNCLRQSLHSQSHTQSIRRSWFRSPLPSKDDLWRSGSDHRVIIRTHLFGLGCGGSKRAQGGSAMDPLLAQGFPGTIRREAASCARARSGAAHRGMFRSSCLAPAYKPACGDERGVLMLPIEYGSRPRNTEGITGSGMR